MWWPWNKPRTCEECEKLRLDFKALQRDTEDALDKVYHWMKRHSARASREAGAGVAESAAGETPTDGGNSVMDDTRAVRIARLLARKGR